MYDFKSILVVATSETDFPLVLEKARVLSAAAHAATFVVRVVYDDLVGSGKTPLGDARRLQGVMMETEQERFEEYVRRYDHDFEHIELITTWNSREWEGVKGVARAINADLIIRAADEEAGIREAASTPNNWNLLRNADCPVMIVRPQQWEEGPVVVAAIDFLDDTHQKMNETILMEADSLTKVLGGNLHIANAYPLLEPWPGDLGEESTYTSFRDDLEDDIRTKIQDSAATSRIGVGGLHIGEGKPSKVISHVVEDCNADLLVMGTAGRAGIVGAVMGNSSEALLGVVDTDVVTLRRERW